MAANVNRNTESGIITISHNRNLYSACSHGVSRALASRVKVKERIVLREIHLRTTGRHLSIGSHSITCHPTEVTAPPSPQPGRLVLDLSTP